MDFLRPARSASISGHPLVNDDRSLTNPIGTEFMGSPAGLDLGGAPTSPLGMRPPTGGFDMQGALANIQGVLNAPTPLSTPTAPSPEAPIFYSPSTGQMVVNGSPAFSQRNATQALASREWANQPRREFTLPDTVTDWQQIPRQQYDSYISSIENPTFGRRMGEAWEHAWRGMADIGVGAVLAGDNLLTGDEDNEWALRTRENILRGFEENAPFMMQLSSVENPQDFAVYASQMLVQGVPWLIETIATMAAGAAVGGVAGGGSALIAREGLRRATMAAIRGRLTSGASAYRTAMQSAGGRALTRQEAIEAVGRAGGVTDDLELFYDFSEAAHRTLQGARGGALAGSLASSYATGVGDIRNTIADAGGDTESAEAMANIFGWALPYAATETLGDIILSAPVARLFPDVISGATRRGNVLRGVAANAPSEGLQEMAQLTIAEQAAANVTGQPIDLEPFDLLEAGLGGALGGAGVGAIVGAATPGTPRSMRGTPTPSTPGTTPSPTGPEPTPYPSTPPVNPYAGGIEIDPVGPEGMSPGVSMGELPGATNRPAYIPPEQSPYDVEYPGQLNQDELVPGYASVPRPPGWPPPAPSQPYVSPTTEPTVPEGVPPELASLPLTEDNRHPVHIFMDIAEGKEVTPAEVTVLRTALQKLAAANPTEPGYVDVLSQLNEIYNEQTITDENSEGFRNQYPELSDYINDPNRLRNPVYLESPMDAAKPVQRAEPGPRARALPKTEVGGDGLRGRTQEAQPSERSQRLMRAFQLANAGKLAELSADDLNRAIQLADDTDPTLRKQLLDEQKKRRNEGTSRNARRGRSKDLRAEERRRIPAFTNKDNLNRNMFYGGQEAVKATEQARDAAPETTVIEDYKKLRDELRAQLQKANKLQLKVLQNKIAKLEAKLKEQADAISERSTEEETVRSEPRTRKEDGKRDTGEHTAAREEAKPENDEGVQGPGELTERESKAKNALLNNARRDGKNARKVAEAMAGVYSRGQKPNKLKSSWVYANGDPLTKEEVHNIAQSFSTEDKTAKQEGPSRKERSDIQKRAQRIDEELRKEWKNKNGDSFKNFVLLNSADAAAWAGSPLSENWKTARRTIDTILDEAGKTQLAVVRAFTFAMPDRNVIAKATAFAFDDTDRIAAIKRGMKTNVRVLQEALTSINKGGAHIPDLNLALDKTDSIIAFWSDISDNNSILDKFVELRQELELTLDELTDPDTPKAAGTSSEEQLLEAIEETFPDADKLPAGWNEIIASRYNPGLRRRGGHVLADKVRVRSLGRQVLLNIDLIKGHEKGKQLLRDFHTPVYAQTKLKNKLRKEAEKKQPKASSDERTGISIRKTTKLGADTPRIALADAKTLVKGVQARMHEHNRFTTYSVYKNFKELVDDAANVKLRIGSYETTLEDFLTGQGRTVRRRRANQFEDISDLEVGKWWMGQVLGSARAGILPSYNALFVFSDRFQSERELTVALEHEYVAHRGLAVIFPTEVERQKFLQRALLIPGMRVKVDELVARFPVYRDIPILDQVEEVIAAHSEVGPLALERLLSAKEGVDQETRRTLWEDLKRLVKDWIDRVFGGRVMDTKQGTADAALDRIVAALREHAIMGQTGDMHALLDELGAPRNAYDAMLGRDTLNNPKAAAGVPTAEETARTLYGSDNPETQGARAYRPVRWTEQIRRTMLSNKDLIDKARDVGEKNVGSGIKQAWKKIGRNIEAMNNMAQRSVLVKKMMDIMHATIQTARSIMTEIQQMRPHAMYDAATLPARKLWGNKAPGSTKKQRSDAGTLSIVATNNRLPLATEERVRSAPRIRFQEPNGTYSINQATVDALLAQGILTKEEFEAGVAQYVVTGDGTPTEVTVEKLQQDVIDNGYDIYVAESKAMAFSVIEKLKGAEAMLSKKDDAVVRTILNQVRVKPGDQAFAEEVLTRLKRLYTDIAFHNYVGSSLPERNAQHEKARQVVAELMRAMHEKEKVKDWLDLNRTATDKTKGPRRNNAFKWREQVDPAPDVKPFTSQIAWFLSEDPATAMPRLERLNTLGVSAQQQYDMLTPFQGLLNAETTVREYENDAIQSLLGNYVEFTRKGKWRVYLDVVDAKGRPVTNISAVFKALLPVTYTNTKREAEALQAELLEELSGEHTMLDVDDKEIVVKFDVGVGDAPGVSTLREGPKIKEFVRVAELAKLKLGASQMARITTLLEHASERKRFGLQRAGTPGMDGDIIENNSATMTQRAWAAAKMREASELDEIFLDDHNVFGDWAHLETLQQNFDKANNAPVRNKAQVFLAERALLRYANKLRYMSKTTSARPTVNIRTTKGEQKLKIEPEGEAHRKHASELKASLERDELEVNLNDLLSKTGPLRYMSVVLQLGSVAAGIMNAFTVITHLPHVLAAFHEKTGYGEGFAYTDIIANIMAASNDVGKHLNMMDVGVLKNLLDEAEKGNNKTNLSLEELRVVHRLTLKGTLMPQQTYSLTGGTESNITNLLWRNLAEALLLPFGSIEAMNRRITALTTYRLAKQRYLDAGISEKELNDPESLAYAQLIEDVQYVVDNSQGDYANINRPKIFRGDLAQYVMQYKMFPLITMHMIYNLPFKQQMAVLGVLFLLSGLKGEPFADDFADIYDTVLQKMGFNHDSVELQLVQALEEIMPGSSQWVMHGALDPFLSALSFDTTLSSRISMGDILPLTGVFRPEADIGRELMNAIGPAFSGNVDALEFAFTGASGVAQILGLRERTMTWGDFIRAIPQAQLKGIGEGLLMARTGEITDPRGRLVSDEVTFMSIAMRMIGFYPLEATRANTAVALDRMHIGYMRNIRARYILSYANAYRRNDQDMMDRILRYVEDWNERARETDQEDMLIRNFRSAAVRAGRAASQTTIERTSSSAPNYSLIDELAEITLADTEAND